MEFSRYIIFICSIFFVEAYVTKSSDYHYDEASGAWLKIHKIRRTWHDARKMCNLEGAILASPLNKALNDAIVHYAQAYDIKQFYVGMHATFSSKIWHSIEGIPLESMTDYVSLDKLETSNLGPCGVFNGGYLQGVSCEELNLFMCYKTNSTNKPETACKTTDEAYKMDERTGSCYKFHEEAKTWYDAYKTCFAEQAYLAIVNNDVEAHVLTEIFAKHPAYTIPSPQPDVMSVGLIDWEHDRQWYTIHGERFEDSGYSYWHKGEPNNAGGEEYCGNFNREGFFNDDSCYKMCAFICEKDVRLVKSETDLVPIENKDSTPTPDNILITTFYETDVKPDNNEETDKNLLTTIGSPTNFELRSNFLDTNTEA